MRSLICLPIFVLTIITLLSNCTGYIFANTLDLDLSKSFHKSTEIKPEKIDNSHNAPVQIISQQSSFKIPLESDCRRNFAISEPGQTVMLQTPNYPNDYPNNLNTSICFTSPTNTTMTVACNDFNIEFEKNCTYDYIGFGRTGDPNVLTKVCGKGSYRMPPSPLNKIALTFKSDGSNPGAGGRSPYQFKCSVTASQAPATTTSAPIPNSGQTNCTCGKRNDGKIVGGGNAKVGEFPWRCYLRTNSSSFFCGCSIISSRWVLTAAHCTRAVLPLQAGHTLFVVVGDHDTSLPTVAVSQQIPLAKDGVFNHPKYNSATMDYDMALLKLTSPIKFTPAIAPVCLPWSNANDEFSGQIVTASGWGTTSQGGSTSNILKEVKLPVLTTQQCGRYYPGQITDRMICTYSPGKDTCQGDSGGSIDWLKNNRYYAIGVVSWGIGCAKESRPGVYAKTGKFLTWIQSTTNERFCKA